MAWTSVRLTGCAAKSDCPSGNGSFSGTIADNIRTDSPLRARKLSPQPATQAHDFIWIVQRVWGHVGNAARIFRRTKTAIAIARALLTQPKILILDDATSSVDVETETKIQDALESQIQGHTTLVIAQRISTVLKADKIVVIDNGRIAAEGTHLELMRQFHHPEIYESQLGSGLRLEESKNEVRA
jgi:ATP-binding cassette subfamily B protein